MAPTKRNTQSNSEKTHYSVLKPGDGYDHRRIPYAGTVKRCQFNAALNLTFIELQGCRVVALPGYTVNRERERVTHDYNHRIWTLPDGTVAKTVEFSELAEDLAFLNETRHVFFSPKAKGKNFDERMEMVYAALRKG